MTFIRSRPRLAVAGLGVLLALAPLLLAASGALRIQLVASAAGAFLATAGVAITLMAWPRRRRSDLHHLYAAIGFFLTCGGVVLMLAGVGLYH